jgi:hypothetical protein
MIGRLPTRTGKCTFRILVRSLHRPDLSRQEALMNDTLLIAIVVLVVLAVGAWVFLQQRRRSEHLRSHFGPEYEREVEERGSRRKAEAELAQREKRVHKLDIRPLEPTVREGFKLRWTEVQARFVDDPPTAVSQADDLLGEVLRTRGYPVRDFEQNAGDISVDHPEVVKHYRAGHDIAVRHERGEASTEDLRQAMIHYRELFNELVEEGRDAPSEERDARETMRNADPSGGDYDGSSRDRVGPRHDPAPDDVRR